MQADAADKRKADDWSVTDDVHIANYQFSEQMHKLLLRGLYVWINVKG